MDLTLPDYSENAAPHGGRPTPSNPTPREADSKEFEEVLTSILES